MTDVMKQLGDDILKSVGSAFTTRNSKVRLFDTGFPPLNKIISGSYKGGIPSGRIVEIYGPSQSGKTHLATEIMKSVQNLGGAAIFLDHEKRFVPEFAARRNLKLDAPHFFWLQPWTWEESNSKAIDIAKALRGSGSFPDDAPIVAILDSVASANPRSKVGDSFDGKDSERAEHLQFNMSDTTALARATSASLPVMAGFCEKLDLTMIYLNQVREKPGVCLRGDTKIPFTDGTSMKIKDVVEQRVAKEVWSWSESEGRIVRRMIVDWHDNGPVSSLDEWIHIRSTGYGSRNGCKAGTFTRNHRILVKDRGWVAAQDVKVGDQLFACGKGVINGSVREFFAGCLFGDSTLGHFPGTNRQTAQLIFQDNVDSEYAKWKAEKLSGALGPFSTRDVSWPSTDGQRKSVGVRLESGWSHELFDWVRVHRDPRAIIEMAGFSDMMLALWIMDDATFSRRSSVAGHYTLPIKRIKDDDELDLLGEALYERLRLKFRIRKYDSTIIFDTESSREISRRIAKYVPPMMERKLFDCDRGKYENLELSFSEDDVVVYETVTSVGGAGKANKGRIKNNRYDITVEGEHNYIAGGKHGGFVVHNSYGDNTTTPGGKALHFYSDVRISLSRSIEKDGNKEAVGQRVKAKAIKAVTAPFKMTAWTLSFAEDGDTIFDREASLIDHMISVGIIATPTKGYVEFDGQKYRKSALVEAIKKMPDGYQRLLDMLP